MRVALSLACIAHPCTRPGPDCHSLIGEGWEEKGPWTGLRSWEIKITTATKAPDPPVLLLFYLICIILYFTGFSHPPRRQAEKHPLCYRWRTQL